MEITQCTRLHGHITIMYSRFSIWKISVLMCSWDPKTLKHMFTNSAIFNFVVCIIFQQTKPITLLYNLTHTFIMEMVLGKLLI